ncbi:calcium homeostasis endoplasmic reticulum protein-like isoform X2 [Photinus pyralis]|nr:calcium homeostasis endoplasmic reticulum protein-like isoform X2 [Photinus pyralis]
MTKNKQKGNTKFQFLFGGEFYNYYQYKVQTEQASMNGSSQNGNWNQCMQSMDETEIEQLTQQQEVLREQIKQSEQNLNAQHTVLLQQQQAQVENLVTKCEMAELQREAEASELPLDELYAILQPIIDSCTKDSISNGKSWILQHSSTKLQTLCIAHCLLYKVMHNSSTFPQKLHVIYLVNDVLHHW